MPSDERMSIHEKRNQLKLPGPRHTGTDNAYQRYIHVHRSSIETHWLRIAIATA